ncbi:MAG TPA: response regulator transcription factor [Azonexus sp.]|nr:response regulator transcription factor [Azonexus sp.]
MTSANQAACRDTPATIYLVEDEPEIARIVSKVLADFGYAAEWFRTGADLMRRVKASPPDLCTVDLGLPDIDGMDLIRQLRGDYACGVLILTGRGYTADRVMGLELGADDYIVKPFEPRELIARIRSILRRCERNPEKAPATGRKIAEFSGWRFDADNNALHAPNTEEFNLSTAEAQLLQLFLERPNRILTREQLLGERDLSPFDRSIDVRISRLRRKLEADPHNPKIIKTVYGAGYLFSTTVTWA